LPAPITRRELTGTQSTFVITFAQGVHCWHLADFPVARGSRCCQCDSMRPSVGLTLVPVKIGLERRRAGRASTVGLGFDGNAAPKESKADTSCHSITAGEGMALPLAFLQHPFKACACAVAIEAWPAVMVALGRGRGVRRPRATGLAHGAHVGVWECPCPIR
jgi:hypothetical protein